MTFYEVMLLQAKEEPLSEQESTTAVLDPNMTASDLGPQINSTENATVKTIEEPVYDDIDDLNDVNAASKRLQRRHGWSPALTWITIIFSTICGASCVVGLVMGATRYRGH